MSELTRPLQSYDIESVAKDVDGAMTVLCGLVENIREINRASVYQRFILGAQLEAIREGGLWRNLAGTGKSVVSKNFDDWLKIEFKDISNYSRETGYAALQLFRSRFMRERPDEEVRKLESTTNAAIMARLERQGTAITDEIFNNAVRLPIKEFKETVGLPGNSRRVEAIVDNPSNAESVNWFLGVVRSADTDAIDGAVEWMQKVFEGPCGKNASDFFDCVTNMCIDKIREEEEAMIRELDQNPVVMDAIDLYQQREDTDGYHGQEIYK